MVTFFSTWTPNSAARFATPGGSARPRQAHERTRHPPRRTGRRNEPTNMAEPPERPTSDDPTGPQANRAGAVPQRVNRLACDGRGQWSVVSGQWSVVSEYHDPAQCGVKDPEDDRLAASVFVFTEH